MPIESETHSTEGSSRGAKWTAVLAAIVVSVVVLGSVLMVVPGDLPGKRGINSIAAPYYAQNWRVFAPNVMKSDTTLEVRAQWRNDSGTLIKSKWMPVTAIEQRQVTGNLAPSRVQKSTWNPSVDYLKRFHKLNEDQQSRVQDTFIERDDASGFRPVADAELIAELGADDGDVVRFLRMDYMLMRFSTQFATAALHKDIERVQWRVVTAKANDFSHRFQDDPQYAASTREFGWRHSNVLIEASVVESFRSMIERSGATDELRNSAAAAE